MYRTAKIIYFCISGSAKQDFSWCKCVKVKINNDFMSIVCNKIYSNPYNWMIPVCMFSNVKIRCILTCFEGKLL